MNHATQAQEASDRSKGRVLWKFSPVELLQPTIPLVASFVGAIRALRNGWKSVGLEEGAGML